MRSAVEDGVKRPRRLGITFGGLSPSAPPRVEPPQGADPSGVPQPLPHSQQWLHNTTSTPSARVRACPARGDDEVGIASSRGGRVSPSTS